MESAIQKTFHYDLDINPDIKPEDASNNDFKMRFIKSMFFAQFAIFQSDVCRVVTACLFVKPWVLDNHRYQLSME